MKGPSLVQISPTPLPLGPKLTHPLNKKKVAQKLSDKYKHAMLPKLEISRMHSLLEFFIYFKYSRHYRDHKKSI